MRIVLPPDVATRARAVAAGDVAAAPIRQAATVVLLRRGEQGELEVYLQHRHRGLAFAGGVHAFPGGGVDDTDALLHEALWSGQSPQQWQARFAANSPRQAAAHVVACVRELFEETGVLLARPHARPSERERAAAAVATGAGLPGLLHDNGWQVDTASLTGWSRWVTPRFERRRFDAWFFVAALPDGQEPRAATGESHDGVWVSPQQGLARLAEGTMRMLPPTWWTLRELAERGSLEAALAQPPPMARHTVGWTVDGDDVVMTLPGDTGYPGDDPNEGA